jgi:hypothetical protein
MNLRPLAYWDCVFESSRGRGHVSYECCEIDVCVGLITRPEESCVVSDRDRDVSIMGSPCALLGAVAPWGRGGGGGIVLFFRNWRCVYFQCKPAITNFVISEWA